MASEALRRLLTVEVIPWEDLDPELTRGVTIEQRADGRVKITPPPLSAANAALKQLRQLFALDEKVALEDAIAGIARATLDVFGDSRASLGATRLVLLLAVGYIARALAKSRVGRSGWYRRKVAIH